MKKKNLKPIEYDINLKYRCPKCDAQHWLALREAKTPGFIIVCECGEIHKVKTIEKVVAKYRKKKTTVKQQPPDTTIVMPVEDKPVADSPIVVVEKPVITPELLFKTSEVLEQYGFTKNEAIDLIKDSYANNPTDCVLTIVKNCLANIKIGENNETDNETFSL